MTIKMNNVDNNERQQRVLLQRGGSILNTTFSMTTNMNDDDYNKRRQRILLQGSQSTIFKTITIERSKRSETDPTSHTINEHSEAE
jgi:hypothetical protein